MKQLLLLAVLTAAAACAQTTITVQITVPTVAGPVASAWLLANCPSPLVASACPVTVQQYVKSVVAQAIQAQLQSMLQWAIANNDASLPNLVKTAITNKQSSDTAFASAQAATNPTVN